MGFQLNAGQANPAFYPGSFSFDSLTPDALAGTVNDWNPPGLSGVSCILINATAAATLNGLAGGSPNRQVILVNQSAFSIAIAAESTGSSEANRFTTAATLAPGAGITLLYSAVLGRWIAAGGGGGGGALPAGTTLQIVQDFINPAGDGWDDSATGAGAAVSQVAGESGHPGIMRCACGTTSSGNAGRSYAPDAAVAFPAMILGGGEIVIDCVLRIPVLSSDAETFFPRVGLMDEISGAPNNGMYISASKDADPAVMVWGAVARLAGVATVLTSAIPVVANTWTHARLVINADATEAELFIDGVSAGLITEGFPTAGMTLSAQASKLAGGTSRNVDYDLLAVTQTLARY